MTSEHEPFDVPSMGVMALAVAAGIVRRLLFGVVLLVIGAVVLAIVFTFQLVGAVLHGLSIGGSLLWIVRRVLF